MSPETMSPSTAQLRATKPAESGPSLARRIFRWREGGLLVALFATAATFGLVEPSYFNLVNLTTILEQASITGILALGVTFVIITAGIDLSFGSTLGLAAVTFGLLITGGVPLLLATLAAMAVGGAAGVFNGVLTTALKISPLIVTLGTMSIFSGLALLLTSGRTIFSLPAEVDVIVNAKVLGIPLLVIVFAALLAVSWFVLRRTRFGEYCIATGGSLEVARLAGIRTSFYIASAYAVLGVLAGLAGVLTVGRLGAADPLTGADLLLPVIAATVIGGASLAGGEGSMVGTALGAILISALQAGLTILVVPSFYQRLAVGTVIILAVTFDQIQKGRLKIRFRRRAS